MRGTAGPRRRAPRASLRVARSCEIGWSFFRAQDKLTTNRRSGPVLSSAVFCDYGIDGSRPTTAIHSSTILIIDEPTPASDRPIDARQMRDEKALKILSSRRRAVATLAFRPFWRRTRPHRLVEIEHFFETYKLLEDKTVMVLGMARDAANEIPAVAEIAEPESGSASTSG